MELLHHGASAEAPLICLVDSPDHPFQLGELPAGFDAAVARFVVADWNAALTPWAAPGLYRGEPDFGGGAAKTLAALFDELAAFEDEQGLKPCSHAVAGYSLGGLFALWAFVTSERFAAVASLSGSTWYDGWLDWLTEQRVSGAGRFAYLSVGTKEKRAALARLRTVEDATRSTAALLEGCGVDVRLELVPGSHLTNVNGRTLAGLSALNAFLA